MDDQAQRCWYSPSGVELRGSKAMLRAAGHVDAGYVPEATPTERWVFEGSDGAVAVLTAPQGTVLPDDPVILRMPADWANMCDWASDPEMILLREDDQPS
jgi:hypothetical protein